MRNELLDILPELEEFAESPTINLAQVKDEEDDIDPEKTLSKDELAEIEKQANQEAGLDPDGELIEPIALTGHNASIPQTPVVVDKKGKKPTTINSTVKDKDDMPDQQMKPIEKPQEPKKEIKPQEPKDNQKAEKAAPQEVPGVVIKVDNRTKKGLAQQVNPYDQQFEQSVKQLEVDPIKYQQQHLKKNTTTNDKPAENQLTLNFDQNIDISPQSQSMEKMLETARFNSHMNQVLDQQSFRAPQQQQQPYYQPPPMMMSYPAAAPNPYLMYQNSNQSKPQEQEFKGYRYYTQQLTQQPLQYGQMPPPPVFMYSADQIKDQFRAEKLQNSIVDGPRPPMQSNLQTGVVQEQSLEIAPAVKSADEFDKGFKAQSQTPLQVQDKTIHTFFGADEETGLNMLVQEQKQLEKMQAYSFQQFKQIQKMMVQMQKSQQWSFGNIQAQIDQIQKKIDDNHKEEMNYTQDLSHSLAMKSYYQNMIKNVNDTKVNLNCTNVFYCENGVNCNEVSMCKQNDTCSLVQKCDQQTGKCSEQTICVNANVTSAATLAQNSTNSTDGPVVHKSKEEVAEAKSRLAQLREHLDVTALFLGQDNVGKIIAKLEMDAADPPIPQHKMPELFQKCQKEVDDFMKKAQDAQTPEEKEQDKKDQDETSYS